MKRSILITTILFMACFAFLVVYSCKDKSSVNSLVAVDEVFPGKVWAGVIPNLKPVKGVGGITAKDCGKCHDEIYKEWKTSSHSQAYVDLQFQAELSKNTGAEWICLNCHIPMQNQREEIIVGLINGDFKYPKTVANEKFDPEFKQEGVSCASCHLAQDEDGETYVIGVNGNTNPPHPVRIERERLKNRCLDCHNEVYELDPTLVCNFQTGDEMAASKHIPEDGKHCSNCHMPTIQRSLVKKSMNKPIRSAHRHTFWGGGVPKNYELYKYLKTSGYKSSLHLEFAGIKELDGRWEITLNVENTNPAHMLTSGDPERHIRIDAVLHFQNEKSSDIVSYKIGQNWEWWPKAKQISDNRLYPKERRKIQIFIPMPDEFTKESADTLSLEISAHHVRLTEENAKSMIENADKVLPEFREKVRNLKEHYPYATEIFRKEYPFAR
ncbi:MAG: cytochrome C554 and C-prime [Leptospira sp.]|nr:cytochrome C554 and C-prime [Leptospira sp.]